MKQPAPIPPATVDLDRLKAEAEARLAGARPDRGQVPARPTDELLHDLQVHQVELEMQNESLRQTLAALEESRDQYRYLYELAPVGYLTINRTGLIESINLTGASLLKMERKKLLQRRFAPLVAPQYRDMWQHNFQRGMQHECQCSCPCQLLLQRGDGTTIPVKMQCCPVMTDGVPSAMLVAVTDVSDLQHALAETQMREDRLRMAKAATGLGVFDDTRGGDHLVDERMREIWGFGPDEAITLDQVMAGVHPTDRASSRARIQQASDPRGDGRYHAEYRVIDRNDGRIRDVVANGQAFFSSGQVSRFIGTVQDVSAQKKLEREARERRTALEQLLNQQVAVQTAAAFAHELNQPLLSVSAYSEAALRMLKKGAKEPAKLAHAIEGTIQQAQRAGKTLHDLLDFLHKGETPIHPLDLNGVVQSALEYVDKSGYVEFHRELDMEPDLPPVLANSLQLQKVLSILLQNSIDALREAHMPAASVTITVRTHAANDMVLVTVRDNGPGLDASLAERVFEPFFTSKSDGAGMGLGLAISRALVESFGGRIWAEASAPGATFHFTVPFAR